MGSKRRQAIKREGKRMFTPDCRPCYTYGGKTLTDEYDRKCFIEGWGQERHEHESALRREAEERAAYE